MKIYKSHKLLIPNLIFLTVLTGCLSYFDGCGLSEEERRIMAEKKERQQLRLDSLHQWI